MDSNIVLGLDEISIQLSGKTGGKAYNLSELKRNGFNVPDGFVLTTEAYDVFIESSGISDSISEICLHINYEDPESIQDASQKIKEQIMACSLTDEISQDVLTAYKQIGYPKVAVRSSATAEDLPDASFAGQYETYLNIVDDASLLKRIIDCYASLWTPRAISYRHTNEIPHESVKLAVLVQKMIPAVSAGVMFTQDPTTDEENHIMIESNFGLGESVVSGMAIPDRFVVKLEKGKRFKLLLKEIGTKGVVIRSDDHAGTKSESLSTEEALQPSLSDEEVIELARLGSQIETLYSAPQDVEWAKYDDSLFILQSRPITTIARNKGHDESQDVLWSRGYSDDYWNDNVTPLFFDLLGDHLLHIVNIELNQIMGYKDMSTDLLRLHGAHVYFNLDVIRNKVLNEIPPFIRSDDVLNYFPEGHGPLGKATMRQLPFNLMNRLIAEIRVMIIDGDGSMTKTSEVYGKWTRETFLPYLQQFDDELVKLKDEGELKDLLRLAGELEKVMMKHFRLVRYGIPVHNIGMNLITNYLLQRFLGNSSAAKIFPILMSCLDHKTSQTNREINRLADIIWEYDGLREFILNSPSEDMYTKLTTSKLEGTSRFMDEFNIFLSEHGVRGYTREPFYPRWGEKPSLVFDILKSLLSTKGKDPKKLELELRKRRHETETYVEEKIKSFRFGKIKWGLLSTILNLARTYVIFREDQRFNLDRWITRNKSVYLEIGKRLVKNAVIKDPLEIFFLTKREIQEYIKTGLKGDLDELAKERHKVFSEHEDIVPPKFIQGDRFFDDPLPESGHDQTLIGLPASQGIVTAHVRVLNTIDEISQVKTGEVLVVSRTDPGWTPIFSRIGGLITESGGILSHGAVVSREYGIPAVTNIRQACKTLQTGQKVTIDGNNGTVRIHTEE